MLLCTDDKSRAGENPTIRVFHVGLAHPETDEAEARSGYEFGGKVFEEEDCFSH